MDLTKKFQQFARLECEGSSPLYKDLSMNIAQDEELLVLSSHASEGQPIPNLFLGAVHYLLLKNGDHPLHKYYPSIVKDPLPAEEAFPEFKDFCFHNKREIQALLQTKRVQTNEVRRCAYLYPVFCAIYQKTNRPLSLVEIGTSAGLQLLWDKYSYSYGDDHVFGEVESSLHLTSEIREGHKPPLKEQSPPIHSRVGIDLNIVDLNQEEEYLWLKALIWPEHSDRLANLENAVKQFRMNPPQLIEGDGIALLDEYVLKKDEGKGALCIFHTHVANQIPEQSKHQLMEKVKKIGESRDVFHIYNNMWDRQLHLDYVMNGEFYQEIIGQTDGHGRWFDWKAKVETIN